MDRNVRVLVANRPRLRKELVLSTLSEQSGIRVVGEAKNEQDVPALVAETRSDFRTKPQGVCFRSLDARPSS